MPPRVVKIAVEQAAYHFDKLYSYIVPDSLGEVKRGCRVLVPFGGGNRKRQGVVVELGGEAEVAKLKPVFSVLDASPLLDDEMMDLALWIKERTFCTIFDVVRAMLPTGFSMRVRPVYRAASDAAEQAAELPLEEGLMLQFIASHRNGIDREKLLAALGYDDGCRLPENLVEKGLVRRTDDAYRLTGDATVRMVRLGFDEEALEDKLHDFKCTDKQKAVLRLLAEVGCASVKEACYFASVTPAVVTTLVRKGLLEYYDEEVLRSPHRQAPACPELVSSLLNGEQQQAFDSLLKTYKSGKAACSLLYGVTGSGKTQVYMNLINQVVADGKQVLVMVPEISLTPQMMSLFLNQYGSRVAVLHSALSMGERMDEWKRIKRGDAQIVVGTRSAVFAPCSRLGLIVMDEEQEHTYKSESSPRYHAREVAKFRCARHGALLLLTSATPSPLVYHSANPLSSPDEATISALKAAVSIQTQSDALYEIPGGLRLRVGRETLEIGNDGTVSYHTSEDAASRYPIGTTDGYTVSELVETTRRLAADTVGASCGTAQLYLMDITEGADGTTEVCYGYSLSGAAVLLPEDGCAARFTVRNGQIIDYTLRFRRYEETAEHSLLLPERQAAAALEALSPEGRELVVFYTDNGGDTVEADWAAR